MVCSIGSNFSFWGKCFFVQKKKLQCVRAAMWQTSSTDLEDNVLIDDCIAIQVSLVSDHY